MKQKKYIQIIVEHDVCDRWKNLAKLNGMPLVTFIKHLMSIELKKELQYESKEV